MENNSINLSPNLHTELFVLFDKGKIHLRSAEYLSFLDIDAEQLWVLRFYKQYSLLPTIKQSKLLYEAFTRKKLTLKVFATIMEKGLTPQKVIFTYSDFVPVYFEEGTSREQIKMETLKVLAFWKNNRTKG